VTYDLANVAIDPFLASMDALVAPQASAKNLELHYEPCPADLAAVADREKLRQVLLNLLSNAIRHTPAGGTITLSAERRGDTVAISVADTGSGIPEDKREEVFEPFVQLDRSLTRGAGGLGLGLAISRDLARGMSGDLGVEGRAGGGARFVLSLPLGVVDEESALASTDERRAGLSPERGSRS
jgi:signal transduction histidine kinase